MLFLLSSLTTAALPLLHSPSTNLRPLPSLLHLNQRSLEPLTNIQDRPQLAPKFLNLGLRIIQSLLHLHLTIKHSFQFLKLLPQF